MLGDVVGRESTSWISPALPGFHPRALEFSSVHRANPSPLGFVSTLDDSQMPVTSLGLLRQGAGIFFLLVTGGIFSPCGVSCYTTRPTLHLVIYIGSARCNATKDETYGDELNMVPVGLGMSGHKTCE